MIYVCVDPRHAKPCIGTKPCMACWQECDPNYQKKFLGMSEHTAPHTKSPVTDIEDTLRDLEFVQEKNQWLWSDGKRVVTVTIWEGNY